MQNTVAVRLVWDESNTHTLVSLPQVPRVGEQMELVSSEGMLERLKVLKVCWCCDQNRQRSDVSHLLTEIHLLVETVARGELDSARDALEG